MSKNLSSKCKFTPDKGRLKALKLLFARKQGTISREPSLKWLITIVGIDDFKLLCREYSPKIPMGCAANVQSFCTPRAWFTRASTNVNDSNHKEHIRIRRRGWSLFPTLEDGGKSRFACLLAFTSAIFTCEAKKTQMQPRAKCKIILHSLRLHLRLRSASFTCPFPCIAIIPMLFANAPCHARRGLQKLAAYCRTTLTN